MKKQNTGFTLIEIVVGIALAGAALGMVGIARQKKEIVRKQLQTNIKQAAQERVKVEEETKITPIEVPDTDENEKERPHGGPSSQDSGSFDINKCLEDFGKPGCIPLLEAAGILDTGKQQRQQQEAATYYQQQQKLYQEAYYYQQQQQQMFDPNQLFTNPYQQFNPVYQELYQQFLPGLYQQIFPGY